MNLYLPGLTPHAEHSDDAGFASVPETRATLARLGVQFSPWPNMRGFALLVAGRAYRLHVNHHGGPALFELARNANGVLQSVASWHGRQEILAHLGGEAEQERSAQLQAVRGRVLTCYDDQGRRVSLDDEPALLGRILAVLSCNPSEAQP